MKYTYCVLTEHVKLTRELTRAQHHKLTKGKYMGADCLYLSPRYIFVVFLAFFGRLEQFNKF